MVKLIDSGSIEPHHRGGKSRFFLRTAVLGWQQAEHARQRLALKRLAVDLDDELFA